MNPYKILAGIHKSGSQSYDVVAKHGELVAAKALETAKNIPGLNPDLEFIQQAGLLHDIGIFFTHAPDIGCTGEHPYLCHGFLGREILDGMGFERHGLVCERHVVAGLTSDDIRKNNLPLPVRDMMPETLEEKIICYADKFFSKKPGSLEREKTVDEVIRGLQKYGDLQVSRFKTLMNTLCV